MSAKPSLSFSFAKKAEPKRVVEALKVKEKDDRVSITGLEEGKVAVDGEIEEAKKLTIACKNPLSDMGTRPAPKPVAARPAQDPFAAADNLPAGLVSGAAAAAAQVTEEDAEALQALRNDIAKNGGDGMDNQPQAAPILMREGSKRARDSKLAPEASKDMFDRVSVDSFGEALLRGMGYDPTKHVTKPVFHSKMRDNCLGLGAKPLLPSEKLPLSAKDKAKAEEAKLKDAKRKAAAEAANASPAAEASPRSASAPAASPRSPEAEDPAAKRPRHGAGPAERSTGCTEPAAKDKEERKEDCWPSRALLVRMVSRKKDFIDFYGAEPVVLEVDESARTCRVKARLGEKSHVLQAVPLSALEPTVGDVGSMVRVIRGKHKGAEGTLAHKSERRSVARVTLSGKEVDLPLGDVCEFMKSRK